MRYKDLDLAGISKILRAHATQIVPPGMRELKNLYLSRSDNAITLRPDFLQENTGVIALSADLAVSALEEFVTGTYYILDYDAYMYFSNLAPFSFENESRSNLSTIYDDGTITTDGRRPVVMGTNTKWHQQVWAGCWIRERNTDPWYLVISVKADNYIVTNPAMPELDGAEYQILRTHPASNGVWPMQFERMGDLLVYNPANPSLPVDRESISGPFYSDIGKADVFGVWKEFTPEIEAVQVEAKVVWAGELEFPEFPAPPLNFCLPLYLAGTVGGIASNDQWVGDYNSSDPEWIKILDKYEYLGEHGRVVYPKGNGYPIPQDIVLLPIGSDSEVVGIEYTGFGLRDGSVSVIATPEGSTVEGRTDEELANGGPYLPSVILGTRYLIDPPAFGAHEEHSWGANGQIGYYGGGDVTTLVTTNIYAKTRVELYDPGAVTGLPPGVYSMFVGGVDEFGPTILIGNATPFDPMVRLYTTAAETDLYDVAYMHAMDEGPHGLGRIIAVGAYGTIIYSDDGGLNWWSDHHYGDSSPTQRHLRKITADLRGSCAMAVGDGGTCLVTIDGENWEQLTVTGKDIIGLSYNDQRGEFVMLESGGSDPIRIKRRMRFGSGANIPLKKVGTIDSDLGAKVFAIIHDGSQFIAAGTSVWTSPDGVTWTDRAPTFGTGKIACLAHNGSGTVVGVGNFGFIATSADSGATWTVIHPVTTNPDIDGHIMSVIYAGALGFYCCGDKVLLNSADGITWAVDATFDFNEKPRFMIYNGADGINPINAREYGFINGKVHIICQSGAIFLNDDSAWGRWEDSLWADPESFTGADYFNKVKLNPASFVGTRSGIRCLANDIGRERQKLFSLGVFGQREFQVEHEHLAGFYSASEWIERQEPGVLRVLKGGDGSARDFYGYPPFFNSLLVMDQREEKSFATPIILWLRNPASLMVSTDGGQTWSKNYPLVIPSKNNQYVEPVTNQPASGITPGYWTMPEFGLENAATMPMVTDGTDAFLVSRDDGVGGGVALFSISWDGLACSWGDPDEAQPGATVIQPIEYPETTALDSITVVGYTAGVS
jgi:photosystem II stability/assembly factor-like uncharacterized protein